jgi:hypothetical protein
MPPQGDGGYTQDFADLTRRKKPFHNCLQEGLQQFGATCRSIWLQLEGSDLEIHAGQRISFPV